MRSRTKARGKKGTRRGSQDGKVEGRVDSPRGVVGVVVVVGGV